MEESPLPKEQSARYVPDKWCYLIKEMRLLAGLTQKQFASEMTELGCEITQPSVARWERGGGLGDRYKNFLAGVFELTSEEVLMLADTNQNIESPKFETLENARASEIILGAFAVRIENGQQPLNESEMALLRDILHLPSAEEGAM